MRFISIMAIVIVIGIGAWFLSNLIPAAGVFRTLEPKLVDQCRPIAIAPGTEDVTIDPDLNIAYISAADRRDWYNETGEKNVNPKNGVYALSLDGSDHVRRVSPPMTGFLPHGISLWRGDNGEKRLFVVNHPPQTGEELVEIFDVGGDGVLTHLESVSFEDMHSPNDVLGVGPRQFYATNDRGFEKGIMAVLESYMALPFSSIVYFDGEHGRIIKKGMTYANGINQSRDGQTVYVAEILKRRIAVFERNNTTGALKKVKSIKVNTGPDNIEIAPDGALWIAGHTRIFEFLAHAKDPSHPAPSYAARINPETGVSEGVFVATQGEINASSVAAANDDTLIIGAVFDGHVMVCPL